MEMLIQIGSSAQKLDSFHEDLLLVIFSPLVQENLFWIFRLSLVCKKFNVILENNSLWQNLATHYWGITTIPNYNYNSRKEFFHKIFNSPYRPCSICYKYPIEGVRYECQNCVDTNLCADCEQLNIHPTNHLIVKTFLPEQKFNNRLNCLQPLPPCTNCSAKVPTLYHESHQDSFYCKSCVLLKGWECGGAELGGGRAGGEGPNHRLWPIKIPLEPCSVSSLALGQNPRGASCDVRFDGCTRHCIGINWKCVCCWGFDICESCDQKAQELDRASTKHTRSHGVMKLYHIGLTYSHWGVDTWLDT